MTVYHQVIEHQSLERGIRAERHVDVEVHAAWAEQCVVQFLNVVGREDQYAFIAAARPQPVGEVEKARKRYSLLDPLWSPLF